MLGFSPVSGGPISAVSPPAAATPGPFGVLGTVGCGTGCGCAPGTSVCAQVCGSPVPGLTIEIYTGATLIASCTSGSSGCCLFSQSGVYTLKIYSGLTLLYSGSTTLKGGINTIALTALVYPYVCCGPSNGGCPVPKTMTLTDVNGSYAFTLNQVFGTPGYGSWQCTTTAPTSTLIIGPPGCTIGSGNCQVVYRGQCYSVGLSPPLYYFSVTRTIGVYVCAGDCVTPPWAFTTGSGPSCGGQTSTGILAVPSGVTCNPFTWSSALTPPAGPLPDPVGGTVTCS